MGLVTKTYQFQASQLEQGIKRCEEVVTTFQSEINKQIAEKPNLLAMLASFKKTLPSLKEDKLLEMKRKISALEDNLARIEKNIDIYTNEIQRQMELKANLQAELEELKRKKEKNVGS